MSNDNNVVELPKLPDNTKKLSEGHALLVENLNLKLNLLSEKINSNQRELEIVKQQMNGFINNIKGNYFENATKITVDPIAGLIMCNDEPKKEVETALVEDKVATN